MMCLKSLLLREKSVPHFFNFSMTSRSFAHQQGDLWGVFNLLNLSESTMPRSRGGFQLEARTLHSRLCFGFRIFIHNSLRSPELSWQPYPFIGPCFPCSHLICLRWWIIGWQGKKESQRSFLIKEELRSNHLLQWVEESSPHPSSHLPIHLTSISWVLNMCMLMVGWQCYAEQNCSLELTV